MDIITAGPYDPDADQAKPLQILFLVITLSAEALGLLICAIQHNKQLYIPNIPSFTLGLASKPTIQQLGKLEAWVDPHALQAYQGVPAIPDAIDAMLQGGHIGKVVVRVAP
eukprot:1152957-Pelagomonas_calceolata.AAC.1